MENHNPPSVPTPDLRILLVGNYLNDRQESMLRFADTLVEGMKARDVQVTLIRPEAFFGRLKPGAAGLGKWLGYLDKFLVFPFVLKRHAPRFDVVHICDHSNAHYTRHLCALPCLVTCNDLLAVRSALGEFPQNPTGWTGRILQRLILRGLKRARRITCISKATRSDVLRLTGLPEARVDVTYMGFNYPYSPAAPDPQRKPYLLHVGGGQWYKNRAGVLAIYAELRMLCGKNPPKLILVGPPPAGAPPGVESVSGVDNERLRALYSSAELLLFPSLEEGFGWPIVEAQACGCRVVTTRKAPMTEIGGDAAFYINDPQDAKAGARTVLEVLTQDAETRRRAVEAGLENAAQFSTEKMITSYLAIYEELMR
jgi:glycosyltransferase involved in cell wall biosynthesis